jgi:Zn-dependent protease with chaperone function
MFDKIFTAVKEKFNRHNVQLYISKSGEVNAFAVGSLRKNVIILTTGLLNSYSAEIKNDNKFLLSIEGIIAHEMSHIINKDYFTALLLVVNERAVNFISRIVLLLFNAIMAVVGIIPLIGKHMTFTISKIYGIFNFFINFFHKKIMLKGYKFIQLQISKSIEYRADRQAAEMVGGENMAFALSLLGKSGFFTIFSSHPSTDSRVKSVKNVEIASKNIRSVFGSNLIFLFSFILIIFISYHAFKLAKVESLVQDYNNLKLLILNKYILIKSQITMFLNK